MRLEVVTEPNPALNMYDDGNLFANTSLKETNITQVLLKNKPIRYKDIAEQTRCIFTTM